MKYKPPATIEDIMKKTIALILACLSASGCTTVADLRAGQPAIKKWTSKTVQEISSCLAQQWAARSGQTNIVPRERGVSMNLTYAVYSSALPAVVVDIDDDGATRSVAVYARKGDNGAKLQAELGRCT
ncbi:MAG: hypothetical protein ACLGIM_07075 [Alphaproteobacteria bacterium]